MAIDAASYMLIFRDSTPETYEAMTPEERQTCMDRWNAWHGALAAEGKFEHGHPLEPTGRIVSGESGRRVVDGPFAEAKEAVGGYFLLRVDSLDEATAIAQQCPNLQHGMIVEVRPVSQLCPVARSLGWQTMAGPA